MDLVISERPTIEKKPVEPLTPFDLRSLITICDALSAPVDDVDPSGALSSLLASQGRIAFQSVIIKALAHILYRNTLQAQFELLVGVECTSTPEDVRVFNTAVYSFDADEIESVATNELCVAKTRGLLQKKHLLLSELPLTTVTLIFTKGILSGHEQDGVRDGLSAGDDALVLFVQEVADSVVPCWMITPTLHCAEKLIARLNSQLFNLLDYSRQAPELPFYRHEILSNSEINQQKQLADGGEAPLVTTPIFQIIEAHALRQPEAVAVQYEQQVLTYSDLISAAVSVAAYLLSVNINKGDSVVVLVRPSEQIIPLMLGIHRVGALYVPVDPTFPVSRIEAIFAEVKPHKVISDQPLPDELDAFVAIVCNSVDVLQTPVPEDIEWPLVTAEDESHIFFTSGTTGKPKGVVSTHGNLSHYICSARERYGITSADRFLSAARFTFSISIFELLVPLSAGGSLHVLARETVLDMKRLSECVAAATVFHFGPSLLKQLLPYIEANYHDFSAFNELHHVSSGGDMVPPDVLEKMKHIFSQAEVFVIYGSSEISCMGCTYPVPRDSVIQRTKVGRPFPNVTAHLFDRFGNYVPLGTAGQIVFSGPGIVKHYLNLPELTEEKFSRLDGKRSYVIGDIGRLDDRGNIELLGRADFQVQIRGMRVELPEIEGCLKRCEGVADCVVVAACLNRSTEKSLVAYLVAKTPDTVLDVKAIADSLKAALPDYMVPAVFVRLEKLPTNHNAKLDRSQLPPPDASNILISAVTEAAQDGLEEELITLWQDMFGLPDIGRNHNFFELGGDSLLAVKFLTQVDQRYGKVVPISNLLDNPTIAEMATFIRDSGNQQKEGGVVYLKRGELKPPVYFMYGTLLYKDLADALSSERSVCSVYLDEEVALIQKGMDSEEFKLFSSVDSVVQHYLRLVEADQPQGPYILGGHSFGGLVALEAARVLQQKGQTVSLVIMIDTYKPGFRESMSSWQKLIEHCRLFALHGWPYLAEKLNRRRNKKMRLSPEGVSAEEKPTKPDVDIRKYARALASKNYVPSMYRGKVLLFKAKQVKEFQPRSVWMGWRGILPGARALEVEGEHMSMLTTGKVHNIARVIQESLENELD